MPLNEIILFDFLTINKKTVINQSLSIALGGISNTFILKIIFKTNVESYMYMVIKYFKNSIH